MWERQGTSNCDSGQDIWAINLEMWEKTSTHEVQVHASVHLQATHRMNKPITYGG